MAASNKIALVTGGSRGLGKNMAQHLAKKGVNVILTYNSAKAEAEAVVAELEATGVKAAALQLNTSTGVAELDKFVASFKETLENQFNAPAFDYLVNNAGTGNYSTIADTSEEAFDTLYNIHFKSVYFLTQKLLPIVNDGGRIINISSGLARFSYVGSSAYASMKGAIETFTRYIAKELGSRGITANVVAPGAIETDFGGGHVRDNAELNKQIAGVTALGRVGLPDDVGGVVAFLCSEEARWVTAQRIEVSGGTLI